MKELWKQYDKAELTHSSAHYLMAMHDLIKKHGYARAVDVARYLNLSRGSVSLSLNRLKKRGFLSEDNNKFLFLTKKGKKTVNAVINKRRIIIQFLKEVLLLPVEIAESDACKIEHLISDETGKNLMTFIGYFLSDSEISKKFKEGFGKFIYACSQQPDCNICELECFFAQNKR